jgi:hypothetical protein
VTPKHTARRTEAPSNAALRKGKGPAGRAHDLWRLPSGKKLAEFALSSGFLAPPLMENARERDADRKKLP